MAKRLTDHERYLRTITEEAWKNTVVELAHRSGWLVTFIPDRFHFIAKKTGMMSMTAMGDAGAPDLLMVGPRSVLHVELKRETGTIKPDQIVWRDQILRAGGEWYCWRPRDYDAVVQRLNEG